MGQLKELHHGDPLPRIGAVVLLGGYRMRVVDADPENGLVVVDPIDPLPEELQRVFHEYATERSRAAWPEDMLLN